MERKSIHFDIRPCHLTPESYCVQYGVFDLPSGNALIAKLSWALAKTYHHISGHENLPGREAKPEKQNSLLKMSLQCTKRLL